PAPPGRILGPARAGLPPRARPPAGAGRLHGPQRPSRHLRGDRHRCLGHGRPEAPLQPAAAAQHGLAAVDVPRIPGPLRSTAMASFELRRRDFLKGCCATAAVGALGPGLFFSPAAHAADTDHDTLVHVFLRGGIDGLNLVVPESGEDRLHYEQARPGLAIAASGAYGALPLTLAGGSATGFGLHPSASGLHELWDEGRLAIVHGCGMQTAVTRSHFDAQLYLDLGT